MLLIPSVMLSACMLLKPPIESVFTLEQARESLADSVGFSVTSTRDLDDDFWHYYARHENSFLFRVYERVWEEGRSFPISYIRFEERFINIDEITTRYARGCCHQVPRYGHDGWCQRIQDNPLLADYLSCDETIIALFNLNWVYTSSSTRYVDSIHTNIVTRTYAIESDAIITRANGDVHIPQGTTINTSGNQVSFGSLEPLIPTTVSFLTSPQYPPTNATPCTND